MKQKFVEKSFRPDSLTLIKQINGIIAKYLKQGLKLTLRQTYYQLVSINAVPNTEQSYKNVGKLVSNGRLAGLIDWGAIEDRIRVPKVPTQFVDLPDLVEAAVASYRLDRWKGQEYYVELWVEKDALAGVLAPLGRKYHVVVMVNRGYSSQSAMYEAAQRFHDRCYDVATSKPWVKKPVLLYIGDFDPSGEDMVRDIDQRLEMFLSPVDVRKIAITMPQIEEYEPPPNPAKTSDVRYEAFAAKHGESSWEVDALPPDVLTQIITENVEALLDQPLMDAVIAKENEDKQVLRDAVENHDIE